MGAKRTANTEMPKGMRARVRKGSKLTEFKDTVYYLYDTGGRPRVEIPLATNDFSKAIFEFERVVRPLTQEEQLKIFEHEKFSVPGDDYIRLFQTMCKGANARNINVAVSQDDIQEMFLDAKGRCAVTGIAFNTFKPFGARMRPWIPSIDRIKREIGYRRDNIRIVCACVNLALNQFGDDALLMIATNMVKRSAINTQAID